MTTRPQFAGELFIDRVADTVATWIADRLDEPVWGAIETGSSRDEGDVWLIVGASRNALAAASKSGRWWQDLEATGETSVETKLARRRFLLDGDELFVSGRLGGGDLVRLFELAFGPRAQALHDSALDHMEEKKWEGAEELLKLAATQLTDADNAPSIAYPNLGQQIALRRAQCAAMLERESDALEILAEVSAARDGDDLIAATKPMHSAPGWLLLLALAHEEAQQPAAAAKVYERLHADSPDQDLFALSRARALRRAGDLEAAADVFTLFVDARAEGGFSLLKRSVDAGEELDGPDEGDDPDLIDADPDLVAACLESGELLEELGRERVAARRYLTLIRHAPFARAGYANLFRLRQSLDADALTVTLAGEVLRLLDPHLASEMDGLPPRHQPFELPCEYGRIDDREHDEHILHVGERATGSVAQKWLGVLTRDERDTRDIERHAQRIDGSRYPDLLALLSNVAAMLGLPAPRLYLSYGSSGVDTLGADQPFILLGASHLDPDDPHHMELRQLAFAIGSQVEHIKAGHVILTSSEFWKTFGTKSATALLALLPLGAIVSKLTDASVLRWVGKFKGTAETKVMRSLLEIAEKRVTEDGTGGGVQSAYTAALAKMRQVALTDDDPEDKPSMVKEQLTEFARSAQYTADRVGLLAADDLVSCAKAMVQLSPTALSHAERLPTEGIASFLASKDDDGELTHEELALRFGELVSFALSENYLKLRRQIVNETKSPEQ